MARNLLMNDVLDREDVLIHNGEEVVTMTGLLKLCSVSAFHNSEEEGRKRGEMVMNSFLSSAHSKGWRKGDLFRSAFAKQYPPTASARALAQEVVALFSSGELTAMFSKPEEE